MRRVLSQVFDVKAQMTVGGIMVVPTRAVAGRAFQDVLSDKSSEFGKHPEDYWLMQLGEQEDDGTLILTGVVPELIIRGVDATTEVK